MSCVMHVLDYIGNWRFGCSFAEMLVVPFVAFGSNVLGMYRIGCYWWDPASFFLWSGP